MTDLEQRANIALAHLQDFTRDLAADLGKIERNRAYNPNFNQVTEFVIQGREPMGLASQNRDLAHFKITDYANEASRALSSFDPVGLETAELAAMGRLKDLVASIKAVSNHDDALALVATFSN